MTARRFVMEADGGSRGNPGPAAYGALVADAGTGEVLATRSGAIGVATNNVAEYRGLVAGLTAAAELDPTALVEVRMDSRLVVEQMAGRWRVKHPAMRPLALAARTAFPYQQVSWTWVPREQNARADALVNAALDGRDPDTLALGTIDPGTLDPGTLDTPDLGARPPAADLVDLPALAAAEAAPPAATPGPTPELGDPTTLLLLRHGETGHTVARRFSGRGGDDPGLTATGHAQAQAVAAALAGRDVAAVVSSPLRRTRETAQAVADVLGTTVRVVDDLAECAFGDWDGLTYQEVAQRWPEEFDAWLWRTDVAPPGGESFDDVARRAARARDRLLARYPRSNVVVVSHVTPVKSLVRLALDAPPAALFRMALSPASLTELQHWGPDVASLRTYNAVGHLPPG